MKSVMALPDQYAHYTYLVSHIPVSTYPICLPHQLENLGIIFINTIV